jgi:hypothetical protein
MDGAPTWMLSWIVVVAIGLSPILVVFIGIVLRRKLVVHQRSGGCPPAEMTEEDEAGNLPVGQTPQHGREPGRYTFAMGDEGNIRSSAVRFTTDSSPQTLQS